jgi:hypothetical protein
VVVASAALSLAGCAFFFGFLDASSVGSAAGAGAGVSVMEAAAFDY